MSDLKYILNRLNSQKREFHQANEQLYGVLVDGTKMKITLGCERDVAIDEVMIYLESIPVSKGSEYLTALKDIHKLGEEAERFKRMKLGMTLKEILEN